MFSPTGIFNWRRPFMGLYNVIRSLIRNAPIYAIHNSTLRHTFRHLITLLRQGLRQQITSIYTRLNMTYGPKR